MKNVLKEAKLYIETRKDLMKLRTAESVSATAGNVISYAVVGVIGLFTLMLFSITLALGLGWALDNNFWGFLIVTLIYVVAGVTVWFNREAIFRLPVLKALLDKMFSKKEEVKGDGGFKRNQAA